MTTIWKNIKKGLLLSAVAISQVTSAQVTPGAGGNLPAFTAFTNAANKFGGFYVTSTARENNSFGGGTRAIVEMKFPVPSELGGTSYTLQYSSDNGANWSNYQYYGTDLTTTGDNFSLNLDASYKLRLLLTGGSKNGYTSNEVSAPLSSIDTRFAGWSLDESMFISGTMTPFVGRGLQASFTVRKLSDDSDITGFLTYQWYRVNPVTYEATAIPLATGLSYTTTTADAGYLHMIKAKGDDTNVGGFSQVLSNTKSVIPNHASISSVSGTGFTLNLHKTPSGVTINDLVLTDKNYDTVLITNVAQGANAAIYNISALLDTAKAPYSLHNNSDFWRIVSTGPMMDDMQGVQFDYDITSGINDLTENRLNVYPSPANDFVNISMDAIINYVSVTNISGQVVLESAVNNNKYVLNTSALNAGVYFLRVVTAKGFSIEKISIVD